MERITFEGNFCDISMCRENPCPYNGMCSQRQTWERLKKYENAEQAGRLVVLPCGVGDTVYWIHNGVITECRVHRVQLNRTGMFICLKSKVSHGAFRVDICLGKTVFLTREEAESALAGKESAALDAPEEPAEPEWKSRVMRTFLGGRET